MRTAIVTGATAGIGLAIAEAFGALGWRVAIGARREDRLDDAVAAVARAGGRGFGHVLDVTDPASVDAFVTAAEKALGPIDVLVNNAGLVASPGRCTSCARSRSASTLETGLLGSLLMSRRVLAATAAGAARRRHRVHLLARGRAAVAAAGALRRPRRRASRARRGGAARRARRHGRPLAGRARGRHRRDRVRARRWSAEQFAEVGYWAKLGLLDGRPCSSPRAWPRRWSPP